MNLEETLKERLSQQHILQICAACGGTDNDASKAMLFSLITHPDDRVGYNALWIFTHLSAADMAWLAAKRTELVDLVLQTRHSGKRRLAMTLLERLPTGICDVRTDYLDFCLSHINSTEPYGIRSLCMRQAFAHCRFYPELIAELRNEIELMEYGTLSAGLEATRRNIMRQLSKPGI